MPDLTVISTALSSLKAATDIAKFLRESDLSLEKAELKMRLADLISALAETKMGLAEVQEALAEKDKVIGDLKLALELKDEVVRRYDAYYKMDESGDPVGVAFCLRCWESDHKLRQLIYDSKDFRNTICPSCGQKYEGRRTGPLKPGEAAAKK